MFYDVYSSLCEKIGKSPSAVAIEIGISKSAVSTWKNLNRTPKNEQLQMVANYFGVSVDYLLGNEQKEKPVGTNLDELIKDEPIAAYGKVKESLTEGDKQDIAKLIMLRAELNRGGKKE